uniref:RWD domain-containing protein 4 n=1 Tax=Schistocephalus solidus TaxID=70667 RepID=A0A0X3NTD1_SCHSO
MDLPSPRLEERTVLESIYTPEELSISSDYTVTFHLNDPGSSESFVVHITWPKGYPFETPSIDLDAFCNRHLPQTLKEKIINDLNDLAKLNTGEPLTFTLIEHLRENAASYFEEIKEARSAQCVKSNAETTKEKPVKGPALTKSQKRRQLNRLDASGNLPRGWNWVDIVKHLRQTGSQEVENM